MSIEKLKDGKWKADIRPNGAYGKRFRKTFPTKAKALAWETWLREKYRTIEEFDPKKPDRRTLADLAKIYHELHGQHLKDSENRKRTLTATIEGLKNPKCTEFKSGDFAAYRTKRIENGTNPNTVNHEQAYLRAMFNELKRLGEWKRANPLEDIRQIRTDQTELTYLNQEEIRKLLEELKKGRNQDALIISIICLSTGARWSEAETLRAEQIKGNTIQFSSTKNGKTRNIPINEELVRSLPDHTTGRLFKGAYAAFRNATERAGLKLPAGQLTHILRHTFASHFMQNGGNILTLQKILDHQSLTMTMRYAHMAPDHLSEATHLNPIQTGHLWDTIEKGPQE